MADVLAGVIGWYGTWEHLCIATNKQSYFAVINVNGFCFPYIQPVLRSGKGLSQLFLHPGLGFFFLWFRGQEGRRTQSSAAL